MQTIYQLVYIYDAEKGSTSGIRARVCLCVCVWREREKERNGARDKQNFILVIGAKTENIWQTSFHVTVFLWFSI